MGLAGEEEGQEGVLAGGVGETAVAWSSVGPRVVLYAAGLGLGGFLGRLCVGPSQGAAGEGGGCGWCRSRVVSRAAAGSPSADGWRAWLRFGGG